MNVNGDKQKKPPIREISMSDKRLSQMETKLDKFLKAFAKKDRMEERLLTMLNLSDTWVQLSKKYKTPCEGD